jgi:hypothetical protein
MPSRRVDVCVCVRACACWVVIASSDIDANVVLA